MAQVNKKKKPPVKVKVLRSFQLNEHGEIKILKKGDTPTLPFALAQRLITANKCELVGTTKKSVDLTK